MAYIFPPQLQLPKTLTKGPFPARGRLLCHITHTEHTSSLCQKGGFSLFSMECSQSFKQQCNSLLLFPYFVCSSHISPHTENQHKTLYYINFSFSSLSYTTSPRNVATLLSLPHPKNIGINAMCALVCMCVCKKGSIPIASNNFENKKEPACLVHIFS